MAEMAEEALRWKVHLKGFGNNPQNYHRVFGGMGSTSTPLCGPAIALTHILRGS